MSTVRLLQAGAATIGLLAAAPVLAQLPGTASPPSGAVQRFEVVPSETGVTRIDTATGAVSRCASHNGTWTCEPVTGNAASTPAPAPSAPPLADPAVAAALADLATRVDALAGRVDTLGATPPATARTAPVAEPSFASKLVGRLFDLVKVLKHPHAV